jgi:Mobilization protein NikA
MPRPRKSATDRRSETLAIRLTPAERIGAEQAALKAGLTASEYARTLVLAGRVVVRQNRTLGHAVFDELRRIGVNLNQLTRLAHQRQLFPAGLEEVFAAIERILAREFESGDAPAADNGAETAPAFYGPITVRFDP